jgi:hypothetical protein
MYRRHTFLFFVTFGCQPVEPNPQTPPTDKGVDTGVAPGLTGGVGSVSIVRYQPREGFPTEVQRSYAVFSDQDGGVSNLARCLYFFQDPCTASLPDVGEAVLADVDLSFVNDMVYYDVGETLVVAGENVGRDDVWGDTAYYTGALSTYGTATDVGYGGDLRPYSGSEDIVYADRMDLVSPPTDERVVVGPGDAVDFMWTAPGTGEVILTHGSTLWHLEDTGLFSLEIDGLGFRAPLDHAEIAIDRIQHVEVNASGNTLKIETVSRQSYAIDFEDLDGWTELASGDLASASCMEATLQPPIEAGQYHGDLTGLSNTHNLGDREEGIPMASEGSDLASGVALQAGETLVVSGRQVQDDLVLMLYDASCDEAYPLAYANTGMEGEEETLVYTAVADETVYLIVDGYEDGGLFSVTVDLQ